MRLPKLRPFAQIRKAVINGAGLVAVIAVPALPLFHGQTRIEVGAGIAIATAIAHYRIPNDRHDTTEQGA